MTPWLRLQHYLTLSSLTNSPRLGGCLTIHNVSHSNQSACSPISVRFYVLIYSSGLPLSVRQFPRPDIFKQAAHFLSGSADVLIYLSAVPTLCHTVHGSNQTLISSVLTLVSGYVLMCPVFSLTRTMTRWSQLQHTFTQLLPAHSRQTYSKMLDQFKFFSNHPECSSRSVPLHALLSFFYCHRY